MKSKSLKRHLLHSSAISLMALMLISGLAVHTFFLQVIYKNAQQQLQLHVYNILSVAEFNGQKISLPSLLQNPRLNTIDSGLWAYVLDGEKQTAWKSLSSNALPKDLALPSKSGEWLPDIIDNDGQQFLTMAYRVVWQDQSIATDYFLIIGEDTRIHESATKLLTLWLVLIFGTITGLILVVQYLALKQALKPIDTLAREINNLEQGKLDKLSNQYPTELMPVEKNINALIEKEHRQRQRYRDAMANLAHSLKTPFTIIAGELNNLPSNQTIQDAMHRIDNNIEYQLRRAIVSGHTILSSGVEIDRVIEHVVEALNIVYRDKPILVTRDIPKNSLFFGDENDLLEIAGNLLDNAFKYAHSQIAIKIQRTDFALTIRIEDDGPGLVNSDIDRIFNRGERLDQTKTGQGIGLAVVADIVISYGGDINVYQSELGGTCFDVKFNNKETLHD